MQNNFYYEKKADEPYYFNFHYAINNTMIAHFHKNLEMMFVAKGIVNAKVDGVERKLSCGDIAIINPCNIHYYNGEEDSEVYILVYGSVFKYLGQNEKDDVVFNNFLLHNDKTYKIFDLLKVLIKENNLNIEMKTGFINYLHGLLKLIYKDDLIQKKSSINDFSNVLLYISKNSTEDLNIEEVALKFGYSKNYFSYLFNKYTGMHFRQYVNAIRLELVEELLLHNDNISICDAVLSCGFNSMNTYYRAKEKQ